MMRKGTGPATLLTLTALAILIAPAGAADDTATAGVTLANPREFVESTISVIDQSHDHVTLRLEARIVEVENADARLPEIDISGPRAVRYERRHANGMRTGRHAWAASSPAPATFAALVQVPDDGRIVTSVSGLELGALPLSQDQNAQTPAPHEGALSPSGQPETVSISDPVIMRDLRLVRVSFDPVTTDSDGPALVESLELTISRSAGAGINEKMRSPAPHAESFKHLYESMVINYPLAGSSSTYVSPARAAATGGVSLERASEGSDDLPCCARYLVIAYDSYVEIVRPLAEWKHTKGVQATVVPLSQVGSSALQIKTFIEDAYYGWDVPPEYVLLVGDTEVLPVYYGESPTDNYYAAIEGSDYLADIMVGRLTADTPGECATLVAKALGYERDPLQSEPHWPASATLMVCDDFDPGDWVYYMNTWFVYDLMESAGFTKIDTLFRRNGISRQDVYDSVNEGRGFLNFRGQAFDNWLSPFDIDPHNTQSGWKLPIVVSATCGTGVYHEDHFVCEDWVRAGTQTAPKGGVAFFGANTIIWGSVELSLRRGYVDEGFFGNAFAETGWTLGEACLAGKLNLFMLDENREEYEGWNLLGDPELNMWTAVPRDMDVVHEPAIPTGQVDFVVTVLSEGSPVDHALVGCTDDEDMCAWAYTNSMGQATIPIETAGPGTLSVTVSARNCFHHEGNVLLIDAGPYVTYADRLIDDSAGGNGDGLLSPGESAEVSYQLTNIGSEEALGVSATLRIPDQFVSVSDSVSGFGNIPPDGTAWGSPPYAVSVAGDCPGGRLVPVSLDLAYSDTGRITFPPPLEIVTGRLALVDAVFDDSPPGGDGDGEVEPGESVAITATLTNDGCCLLESVDGLLASSDPFMQITAPSAPFPDAPPSVLIDNAPFPFVASVSPMAENGHVVTLELSLTATGHSYAYSDTLGVQVLIEGATVGSATGPDEYGYYAYDSDDTVVGPAPTFDWIDIAPPGPGTIISEITNHDAQVTTFALPFPVDYYGAGYSQLSVCSNGFLAVGATDYRYGDNSGIPSTHGPPNMIAPFWDDLDPSAGGDVYKWLDSANNRFIVQFENVKHWGSQTTETFQVIFLNETYYPTPTGDEMILFQYEDVGNPGGCTVGIENNLQTDGIQYLFDGAYASGASTLRDGQAILFTTEPPDELDLPWLVLKDVIIDDSQGGNGNGQLGPGESATLSVELRNDGSVNATGIYLILSSAEPAITISDSTGSIFQIPVGGSGSNLVDRFSVDVSTSLVDTIATFWLRFQSNGGTYAGAVRFDLHLDTSGTSVEGNEIPTLLALKPCFPNPFSGATTVHMSLPRPGDVQVRVYGPTGRMIRTILDAHLEAGERVLTWDGMNDDRQRVACGVYFVKLVADGRSLTRKAVLLR